MTWRKKFAGRSRRNDKIKTRPPLPTFRYFLSSIDDPISPGSSLWNSPLPLDRHHFRHNDAAGADPGALTHGDYFTAAHRFIEREWPFALSTALNPDRTDRISDIQIRLMKHGEFYHPALIRLVSKDRPLSFVLNVAVSESGRRIVDSEVSALKRLGAASGHSLIPRVYGSGSVAIGSDLTADMFLGEWFEGYHEFHLSRSPSDAAQTLCAWGEDDVPYFLMTEEAVSLYHQAAKILTLYFNPATTEHISHWHHAAGDFVVKRAPDRLTVKLITVRQYSPMLRIERAIRDPGQKHDQAMASLLLFFLLLSIRMRLDRFDGVGDLAWADDTAVIGVWTGFLEGLEESCFPFLPNPLPRFENYLSTYSTAGLRDLAETIAAALPAGFEEKPLIESHIDRHMEALCDTISRIGFP